jgi:hypothetical protein
LEFWSFVVGMIIFALPLLLLCWGWMLAYEVGGWRLEVGGWMLAYEVGWLLMRLDIGLSGWFFLRLGLGLGLDLYLMIYVGLWGWIYEVGCWLIRLQDVCFE